MKIAQRIIPTWEHKGQQCKFCQKQASDEVVMNDKIQWFLCLEHKQNHDMMLAFQDLTHHPNHN